MNFIKIKGIKSIGKEAVYNMEVEEHHNFSVNGGLIVHNCYDSFGYGLILSPRGNSKAIKEGISKVEEFKKKKIKQLKCRAKKPRYGIIN